MQRDDQDQPKVISFASRKLLDRECRYSTVERELLSIYFALNKFRNYVYGKRIKVLSDHRALQWLSSVVKTNSRLAKWALAQQSYDLEIHYVSGKNQLADAFTRPPISLHRRP